MGNLYNSNTAIPNMFEEHASRDKLMKKVVAPERNSGQSQRRILELKSVKKEDFQIKHYRLSPTPELNTQQVLAKLHGLSTERASFQEIWNRVQLLLAKSLKFTLMLPEALNAQGEQLLKNGSFFVYWLKILEKYPCVNMNMVYKNVRQRYQPKVTHQKHYLQQFLSQQQNSQTPLKKTVSNQSGIKRSALKKSQKKVQFGKDQIIYPSLEQYRNINIPAENKKQMTRSQQAFLLDYFEINEIYLLDQVTIVGVVKQFDDTYAIIQARVIKEPTREVTCIGIIAKHNIRSHSLKTLQEIEKQFENLSFLELEGKSVASL